MNIVIIIECAYGMPGPDCYIDEICNVLNIIDRKYVTLKLRFDGISCYVINNVDKTEYYDKYSGEVSEVAYELYRDGFIQYFYIGEYDDIDNIDNKLMSTLELAT